MSIHSIRVYRLLYLLSAALLLHSCSENNNNQLTTQESKDGWYLLFDGKSTDGWHLYNQGKTTSKWMVKEGELYSDTSDQYLQGDLVTDKEYRNFELSFEWKIAKGGNSGVFINVQEKPYLRATWASGPEYQLLDKSHPDNGVPDKRSGAMFGLDPPLDTSGQNDAGQWNISRIKQVNGKIEFYLNGVLTVRDDLGSSAWQIKVAKSNFKNFPEFGKQASGHIALQYWTGSVSFRNIKIKPL